MPKREDVGLLAKNVICRFSEFWDLYFVSVTSWHVYDAGHGTGFGAVPTYATGREF
jgi:hypothetical protein